MRKFLSLFSMSLLVLLMFVGPGNVALAHEGDNCGCPTPVEGSEKNKIVAKFLSSDDFKSKKLELLENGYQWQGISKAQVIDFKSDSLLKSPINEIIVPAGSIGIAVPFINMSGSLEIFFFINGEFSFSAPLQGSL
nr:hypothetical protein [Neobacillus sp. Marseille-Q6967]